MDDFPYWCRYCLLPFKSKKGYDIHRNTQSHWKHEKTYDDKMATVNEICNWNK